ncbi:MAG: PAS domain-containing protein [Enterocloster sp.]
MQELNILNNDMPGGYHRCARTKDFDFTYISSRFLEIFGYSRQQIKDLFDNKFINMIHPEDRRRVTGEVDCLACQVSCGIMVYRMQSSRGYIWIMDQTNYLIYEDREYLQGVVTDLSRASENRGFNQINQTAVTQKTDHQLYADSPSFPYSPQKNMAGNEFFYQCCIHALCPL